MSDKLFYSYNSTWNNSNSLKYTKEYTYAIILNPKNHILAYDGKEYGIFHDNHHISTLSYNCFINTSNVVTGKYYFIKIPHETNQWSGTNISFDITLTSLKGISKYYVSGRLGNNGADHPKNHCWHNTSAVSIGKNDSVNDLNNLRVYFSYFHVRKNSSTSMSAWSYWPIIILGSPSNSTQVLITISNINTSTSFTNNSYNLIDDPSNNLDGKWEISAKNNIPSTYFISDGSPITNTLTYSIYAQEAYQAENANIANMAQQLEVPVKIWGQDFNGQNDVYGDFKLISNSNNNRWYKSDSTYILRTDKINVNCNDSGNQLAVAGTAVISNTAYLCSGGGNAYIGVSNVTNDAIVNNGALQAKLYVNGISYVSKLNVNSKDTSLNYACRIAGKNSSSTGGSSSQYSIYATNGWNYLAGNTGIKHVPNTKYKLYIQGDNADEFGGSSNNYSTYITHGWNFLAGNTGVGQFPDSGIKLWVFGDATSETGGSADEYSLYSTNGWNYLASSTGIGTVPVNNIGISVGSFTTPIKTTNTNLCTNLNADLLDGYHITSSRNWFGVIPYIGDDGVMDIGKYIDFHFTDTENYDYYQRLCLYESPHYEGINFLPLNNGVISTVTGGWNNLVCLGVLYIYRSSASSVTWSVSYCAGLITATVSGQPNDSNNDTYNGTNHYAGIHAGGVKLTCSLLSGAPTNTLNKNINIYSVIPVVVADYEDGKVMIGRSFGHQHHTFVEVMAIPTNTLTQGSGPSIPGNAGGSSGKYIIVWAKRTCVDSGDDGEINYDGMIETGDGSPVAIKLTLFGYIS